MKVMNILTTAALLAISLVAGTASAQYNGLQNSRFSDNASQPRGGRAVVNIGGFDVEFGYEAGRRRPSPEPVDPRFDNTRPIGGMGAPQPFTKIEMDSRGQRWKVEGFVQNVRGRMATHMTRRTKLRNGVQFESGKQGKYDVYDSHNDTFHRKTTNTKIYDSASDAYRNHVDGGRKTYVNRIEIDPRTGERVRVTGYEWTSYGKYHGNLKRTKIRVNGFGDTDVEETHAVMAPAPRN